ncbi:hypothetical protein [uncultured Methylobacterium sp.]|uniref:hypothetical protein n=1 Tax=uncultured Methylobacterium sp. TaxID=157278 RepID=UPI0035CA594E
MIQRTLAWGMILLGAAMVLGGLGGCAKEPPQVTYVDRPVLVPPPPVAPTLLRCMPEPEPLAADARQRDVAPYTLALAKAGADCRRKLGTVRTLLKEPTS